MYNPVKMHVTLKGNTGGGSLSPSRTIWSLVMIILILFIAVSDGTVREKAGCIVRSDADVKSAVSQLFSENFSLETLKKALLELSAVGETPDRFSAL